MSNDIGQSRDQGGVVEIRSVTKSYGSVPPAVDNVTLSVPSGQFLTLLGPSGSGKTTTLMMLAGFVEPDAGEILINGVSMKGVPAHRRAIGMVFQHYALFPHMTVFENVAYPLKARSIARHEIERRVREALELIQLPDVGGRYPKQLSGGQQQRIALARALVFRPKLLLMDEPLGALDRKLRELMQIELRSLQKQLGITTISVTHDQEEAMALSDQVVVMKDGRIEQQGTAKSIYERPVSAFIADFLGTANLINGESYQNTSGEHRFSSGHLDFPIGSSADASEIVKQIVIRPERVRWTDHEPAETSLPATVDAVVYLGERIRYRLLLADGQALMATVPNRADIKEYAPNETVNIGWKHEDVVYL